MTTAPASHQGGGGGVLVPKTEPCNSYQSQQPVEYKSEKEIMVNDRDLDKLFESDSADTSDDEHLVRKREREMRKREGNSHPRERKKREYGEGRPFKKKDKARELYFKEPVTWSTE